MGFFDNVKKMLTGLGVKETEVTTEIYAEPQDQPNIQPEPTPTIEKPETITLEDLKTQLEDTPNSQQEVTVTRQKTTRISKWADIYRQIRKQGINLYTLRGGENTSIGQAKAYKEIFTSNAKLEDDEIFSILFENRHRLSHRFVIELRITTEHGQVPTAYYQNTLLEDFTLIEQFVKVGDIYRYETFNELHYYLETNTGRSIGQDYIMKESKVGKIHHIEKRITFA